MEKLKVLIYEPYVFDIYGNTKHLTKIFKYIDRNRFDLILVSPLEGAFLEVVKNYGGRCEVLPAPAALKGYSQSILKKGTLGKIMVMAAIIRYSRLLYSFIIKEKVDIIHCHNIRSLLTVCWAAKLAGKPCTLYVRGELNNGILDRVGFFMADKIIFLSKALEEKKYPRLTRFFKNKIVIIETGIDIDEFEEIIKSDKSALKNELGLKPGNIYIAYLGVITPNKGVSYLVDALALAKERVKNIVLFIVGGYYGEVNKRFKEELDSDIKEKGLEKNVVFTGWRRDAAAILSLMDIYTLPSLTEGVPRSILEASIFSKPVIATPVGGITDIVKNGYSGLLVEPRNAAALAKAIEVLAKDDKLRGRFGRNARSIALKYHVKDNVLELENFFIDLAERKKDAD